MHGTTEAATAIDVGHISSSVPAGHGIVTSRGYRKRGTDRDPRVLTGGSVVVACVLTYMYSPQTPTSMCVRPLLTETPLTRNPPPRVEHSSAVPVQVQ